MSWMMRDTMRIACLMKDLPWPLHGGQEVHAHNLIRQALRRGHGVELVLSRNPGAAAIDQWPLAGQVAIHFLDDSALDDAADITPPAPRGLASRWLGYWGWRPDMPRRAARAVAALDVDYLEAIGMDILPLLTELPTDLPKIWLAADDWCLHHLTLASSRPSLSGKIGGLMDAARMALYERMHARHVTAAVAVSPADEKALRWIGGFGRVLLAPNGVDEEHFQPSDVEPEPCSAIFWGRLDFEPNIRAITWFADEIWPAIAEANPQARWRIIGKGAAPELASRIGAIPGVEWIGEVADIRPWAHRSAVVVLPVLGGAGIKNKLLEAAAMGKPILASPDAVRGLAHDGSAPWRVARDASEWSQALGRLWSQPGEAQMLAGRARHWAVARHSWAGTVIRRERLMNELNEGKTGSMMRPRSAA